MLFTIIVCKREDVQPGWAALMKGTEENNKVGRNKGVAFITGAYGTFLSALLRT